MWSSAFCFWEILVEITLGMAAPPGFGDWSKYIKISQHHIRYYHIRCYHNNVYIWILYSYPILFRLTISPSGLDFLLLFDTLNTECSLFCCLWVVPDPKADARPETILLPVKLFMDSWIWSNRCPYQHKPSIHGILFACLAMVLELTRCTECRGKKLAYPPRQGSDAPDSNSMQFILMGLSENTVYSQWNSHLMGIMIINHWV